jgi:sialate O-acetylesterase
MHARQLPRLAALFALIVSATCYSARGEIRLPRMLSDHAVLQRERPIHLWGWSDPNEAVAVEFHNQKTEATANALGLWELWLRPEAAGGPYTLTVSGSQGEAPLTVNDILVGDVWFASGQSNMQIPLNGFPGSAVIKNAAQEIAAATHPEIRLLHIADTASAHPLNDITATWTRCDPATAADFSAVAYFFVRELQQHLHVPIGLIDSTWGGTPIESWMSLNSLAADSGFMPIFAARARFADQQANLPASIAAQKRAIAAAVAAHQPPPSYPWHPDERSWDPSWLYNGMVAPATPYTIRGFLWYQGEANTDPRWVPSLYRRLFPAMIADWRARWHEGDLPFLYVQLSSFYSPKESWGMVRDAQRTTLSLVNTGMAVSLDIGERDNVHPPDKQTVGHRLALAALHLAYGEAVEDEGPLFRQVTREGEALRVAFDHAAGLTSRDGAPRSFEVEGADGQWSTAEATIEGDAVLVKAAGVAYPQAVRYGWASYTDANLYNRAGLPASTFTAEVP